MAAGDNARSRKATSLRKGKGIKTAPEVQAQIIAALLTGQFQTDEQVAEASGVSKHTVSRIKRRIPAEYLRQVETLKKDQLGDLVAEHLTKALESQIRTDEVTMNEEWLLRQDAASLATLYGVRADKIYRLLEAFERANRPEPDVIDASEVG